MTPDGRPTPTYTAWGNMRSRCSNPKHKSYADYGARGISVCDEWAKFEPFLASMGERPPGTQLDRIDNNKGYGPGNCRWATPSENSSNRRSSHRIEFEGVTKTICQWAGERGMNHQTLSMRFKNGWSIEEALTTPVRSGNGCNRGVH